MTTENGSTRFEITDHLSARTFGGIGVVIIGEANLSHHQLLTHDPDAFDALASILTRTAAQMRVKDRQRVLEVQAELQRRIDVQVSAGPDAVDARIRELKRELGGL